MKPFEMVLSKKVVVVGAGDVLSYQKRERVLFDPLHRGQAMAEKVDAEGEVSLTFGYPPRLNLVAAGEEFLLPDSLVEGFNSNAGTVTVHSQGKMLIDRTSSDPLFGGRGYRSIITMRVTKT